MPTLGAEIEKPISNITTGKPQGVSAEFFPKVASQLLSQTQVEGVVKHSDKDYRTILGVQHPSLGDISLDNAFNNQETAVKTIDQPTLGACLADLEQLLRMDLSLIQEALASEGATVVNLSNHPLCKTDQKTYRRFVAPKTIYDYLKVRGWNHAAGIDAKAQNSPTTGVSVENAAAAVTAVIGAGAAIIGLFGNSPISEGRSTGIKENRLNLWDKMMANSISEGDRVTARFPSAPFNTLADYFNWMFGPGTNIHFVIGNGGYKSFGDSALLVEDNPSVLDYLQMSEVRARRMVDPSQLVTITPKLTDLEAMQFAQFTGARVRWSFTQKANIPDFLHHLKSSNLEEYLDAGNVKYMYIEGRDPGANFPDSQLQDIDSGLAWSALVSPSAIQAGLINNLSAARSFIGSFDWQLLGQLRKQAIINGLDGQVGDVSVFDFTQKIVGIAAAGLPASAHHLLAYPEHVLQTKQNGADRALAMLLSGLSVSEMVISRNVVV